MPHYLLIGAGFTRNWGGPLSDEITGSLLGELHDDPQLAAALRRGPFEEAFQGFQTPTGSSEEVTRLRRFQNAVTELFLRLNRTLLLKQFEFNNDLEFSVKKFLARFDAIFSLNQDLLLEIQYMQTFVQERKWSGVVIPGMQASPPSNAPGPIDCTMWTWRPAENIDAAPQFQPLYKLHGSSNWMTASGEPLLIMGNVKTGSIERFGVLRNYHDRFAALLNQTNARLMVIGYSFQDAHINSVIESAWRQHGLGTYLVDPRGRDVLIDPKEAKVSPAKTLDSGRRNSPINLISSMSRFGRIAA